MYQQCQHTNYIEITQSVISKLVYLLTVQEAHKEYNSFMDQLQAKYEPQTPLLTVLTNIAFNALCALIFVLTVLTNIPYTIALL